jgi:hypothetical protein
VFVDCGDVRSQLFIPISADASPSMPTGISVMNNDTIRRVDILSENPAPSVTLLINNASRATASLRVVLVGTGVALLPTNANMNVVVGCGFAGARYFNLDGAVLSETVATTDLGCHSECCVTPGCTGHSRSRARTCVLFTNVTGLVPNIDVHSGVLESALSGDASS